MLLQQPQQPKVKKVQQTATLIGDVAPDSIPPAQLEIQTTTTPMTTTTTTTTTATTKSLPQTIQKKDPLTSFNLQAPMFVPRIAALTNSSGTLNGAQEEKDTLPFHKKSSQDEDFDLDIDNLLQNFNLPEDCEQEPIVEQTLGIDTQKEATISSITKSVSPQVEQTTVTLPHVVIQPSLHSASAPSSPPYKSLTSFGLPIGPIIPQQYMPVVSTIHQLENNSLYKRTETLWGKVPLRKALNIKDQSIKFIIL